jgi:acetylornithine deacetylase
MNTLTPWETALLEFVDIPSPTGSEQKAATFLKDLLRRLFPDGEISTYEVAPNRHNVYCHLPKNDGSLPIIFTSHFDTVPGNVPVTYDDDYLIGRGTCDAKGQIIAQIWSAKKIIEQGQRGIALCFVVGEETDSIGARNLITHLPKSQYLLNGEPTANRFVSKSWGVLDAIVRYDGISQHSSLGTEHSAVHKMCRELATLCSPHTAGLTKALEQISVNVGLIAGGLSANTTAPDATAQLSVRYAITTEECISVLKEFIKVGSFSALPPLEPLPLYVPSTHKDRSIEVKFASDCSVFNGHIPYVMLRGPGSIVDAHTEHEKLSRKELSEAIDEVAAVVGEILS